MRGRPAGQLTHRRQQVLAELVERAQGENRLPKREIMRRCGLHDYSSLLRIERDLKRMGHLI
ncbi:hypothetical protein [Sphingobium olei]|uniref:LexA repressor DNA-binding domain-containing protein n=1 Tax=Sphingobium olei TaxID=420955 RepID=A0ABW3NXW4_9SPHN